MKNILLEAQDVSRAFEHNRKNMVLNHVSTQIYEGDFTVIMGPSGAGKSTLLYSLSGMDRITGGKVLYQGKELPQEKEKEKEMAVLRASEFGFIFQQIHLVSNLTLFENVKIAGFLGHRGRSDAVERRAEELLNRVHVEKAKDRLPSQVSGGEAQRAAIARAMINEPGLLFADEPTGALNKKNTVDVLDLLTELNRSGQSILMVTHDVKAALRGNRILYLEDGRILDELVLPSFGEQEPREREEKINGWLSSMEW